MEHVTSSCHNCELSWFKAFFPITGTVEPGIWNTLRGHQKSILFHMKVIFKQGKYSWANYIPSFNGKMIKKISIWEDIPIKSIPYARFYCIKKSLYRQTVKICSWISQQIRRDPCNYLQPPQLEWALFPAEKSIRYVFGRDTDYCKRHFIKQ